MVSCQRGGCVSEEIFSSGFASAFTVVISYSPVV